MILRYPGSHPLRKCEYTDFDGSAFSLQLHPASSAAGAAGPDARISNNSALQSRLETQEGERVDMEGRAEAQVLAARKEAQDAYLAAEVGLSRWVGRRVW